MWIPYHLHWLAIACIVTTTECVHRGAWKRFGSEIPCDNSSSQRYGHVRLGAEIRGKSASFLHFTCKSHINKLKNGVILLDNNKNGGYSYFASLIDRVDGLSHMEPSGRISGLFATPQDNEATALTLEHSSKNSKDLENEQIRKRKRRKRPRHFKKKLSSPSDAGPVETPPKTPDEIPDGTVSDIPAAAKVPKKIAHALAELTSLDNTPNVMYALNALCRINNIEPLSFNELGFETEGIKESEEHDAKGRVLKRIGAKDRKRVRRLIMQSTLQRAKVQRAQNRQSRTCAMLWEGPVGSDGKSDPKDLRLIVSIPRKLVLSSLTFLGARTSADGTQSPMVFIELKSGFLKEIYDKFIKADLVECLETILECEIEEPCGLMSYFEVDLDSLKIEHTRDAYNLPVGLFAKFFKGIGLIIDPKFPDGPPPSSSKILAPKARIKFARLIKCTKDVVYYESAVRMLKQLFGRDPNDVEVAFAFGVYDIEKFKGIINYAKEENNCRFAGISLPLSDLIFNEIKAYHYKKRNIQAKRILDPRLSGVTKGAMDAFRTMIATIHLDTLKDMGKDLPGYIYKISYSAGKRQLVKGCLPGHLSLSTAQLGKRAIALYNKYTARQDLILREINYARDMGIQVDYDSLFKDPFSKSVVDLELGYGKCEPNSVQDTLRQKAHRDLVMKAVCDKLKVPEERIEEAVEALECKEVFLLTELPPREISRSAYSNDPMEYPATAKYYGQLFNYKVEDPPNESVDQQRQDLIIKSMRMLALEALDDRLARYVYMAAYNLFLDSKEWDPEEVANVLEIQGGTKMVEFILYTARLQCQEYEMWRIKLDLPPYINEWVVNPRILQELEIDPRQAPSHVVKCIKEVAKQRALEQSAPEDVTVRKKRIRTMRRQRLLRMQKIKPHIGTIEEIIQQRKNNVKKIEKILERSPLVYLSETSGFI